LLNEKKLREIEVIQEVAMMPKVGGIRESI
jgi:hypothetical protein